MKSQTLQEHVADAVTYQYHPFSAHQLTQKIRQLSNEGKIVVTDADNRQDGKQEIDHNEVRNCLSALVTHSQDLSRSFNGQFFLYVYNGKAPEPVSPPKITVSSKSDVIWVSDHPHPDLGRIRNYLDKKKAKGHPFTTVRAIQNSFSPHHPSAQDVISQLNSLGYMVHERDEITNTLVDLT